MKTVHAIFIAGLLMTTAAVMALWLPDTHVMNRADVGIMYLLNGNRWESSDVFWIWLSKTSFYVSVLIPLGMFLISKRKNLPGLKRRSYLLMISWAASVIILNILKHTINRPRPFRVLEGIEKLSAGGSPSFPSGHTIEAFTVVMTVILLVVGPKWFRALLLLWALMVAYSRICLGVHYPSDVLAGAGLGMMISGMVVYFFKKGLHPGE